MPPASVCTLRGGERLINIPELHGGASKGLRQHGQTMRWAEHINVMLLQEDMTMQSPIHLHPTAQSGFAC